MRGGLVEPSRACKAAKSSLSRSDGEGDAAPQVSGWRALRRLPLRQPRWRASATSPSAPPTGRRSEDHAAAALEIVTLLAVVAGPVTLP
jgi:hypothetical protein